MRAANALKGLSMVQNISGLSSTDVFELAVAVENLDLCRFHLLKSAKLIQVDISQSGMRVCPLNE